MGKMIVSKDADKLQLDRIETMLHGTYWAKDRSGKVIRKSVGNSMCYGAYEDGIQIGFARVITDHATFFYLCDIVVDERCRGRGIGKKLLGAVVDDEELKPLFGMLITSDAHGLYERCRFIRDGKITMIRPPVAMGDPGEPRPAADRKNK